MLCFLSRALAAERVDVPTWLKQRVKQRLFETPGDVAFSQQLDVLKRHYSTSDAMQRAYRLMREQQRGWHEADQAHQRVKELQGSPRVLSAAQQADLLRAKSEVERQRDRGDLDGFFAALDQRRALLKQAQPDLIQQALDQVLRDLFTLSEEPTLAEVLARSGLQADSLDARLFNALSQLSDSASAVRRLRSDKALQLAQDAPLAVQYERLGEIYPRLIEIAAARLTDRFAHELADLLEDDLVRPFAEAWQDFLPWGRDNPVYMLEPPVGIASLIDEALLH